MEKSNAELVLAARAQLKSELESIFEEIRGENSVEDAHVYGLYHVITYSQFTRLEQLVSAYRNKVEELAAPMFSLDPAIMIAVIRTSIPAYEEGGKVQLGYAVRDSIFSRLSEFAYTEEHPREVDSSLLSADYPILNAAVLTDRAQNVQPRIDALISQVTAQLERSRQVLGSAKTSQ